MAAGERNEDLADRRTRTGLAWRWQGRGARRGPIGQGGGTGAGGKSGVSWMGGKWWEGSEDNVGTDGYKKDGIIGNIMIYGW
jgi:hypothetical protein